MSGDITVRLDGNESCFPLPQYVMGEIAECLLHIPLNRYPDPYATEVCGLAEAFWNAPKGSAVAGNGSDELLSVALGALLPRGGKILVCDPDFSMYRFYAALNELECVGLERVSGVPDASEIIQKGSAADAVILSNPCNPTGQGLPLADILRIIEELSCPVLLDEAYMDFWDGGSASALPYIERYSHLLVFKTCSKNLAMAGARLGFAFAGEKLAAILRSVKSPYNVSATTQAIGAVVLRHSELLRENTRKLCEAKDSLYARLSEWAKTIEGCTITDTVVNFVLVSLPDARGWYEALRRKGIAVRLTHDMLRITAGIEVETEALLSALKAIGGTYDT